MKIALIVFALGVFAGCAQTTPTPPEARWSGPYHKGSGSGRGYPLLLAPDMTAADYRALAAEGDAAQ